MSQKIKGLTTCNQMNSINILCLNSRVQFSFSKILFKIDIYKRHQLSKYIKSQETQRYWQKCKNGLVTAGKTVLFCRFS